jgi:4-aminobutyrate aminotransferase
MRIAEQDAPRILTELPGPRAAKILAAEGRWGSPSYSQSLPIVWDHALDCVVADVDGNRFIDLTAGIVVANVGHSHPRVVRAIQEQSARLITCYDAVHEARAALIERLAGLLPGPGWRVVLLTTGSEAVEAAIKIARLNTGRHEIVSFRGSFHGRTYGALSASGISGPKKGFGPLLAGFIHAPYPYCYRCPVGQTPPTCALHGTAYLDELLASESTGDVAAVLIEPYLGVGGCVFPPAGYLKALREFCDRKDVLLILDEIQSGFGRTGKMFAFEHEGIVPDILCVGKGMTSGVPTAAVLARSNYLEAMPAGSITSTNAGNPLSAAACLATIDVIEEERLVERSSELGAYFLKALSGLQQRHQRIGDVRGRGLAIALEFVGDQGTREPNPQAAARVVQSAFRRGVLLLPPVGLFGNVVRITPPLTISHQFIDRTVDVFWSILEDGFN